MRTFLIFTVLGSLGSLETGCAVDPTETPPSSAADDKRDDLHGDGDEPATRDPFPPGMSNCALTESIGKTRIQVRPASGTSYCGGCSWHTSLSIGLPGGGVSQASNGFQCGQTVCETCRPGDCLEILCLDYDTGNVELVWDGAVSSTNTCGDNTSCSEICFLPAGRYKLTYCTTRGVLIRASDTQQVCENEVDGSGQPLKDCVSTEFDYPSEPDAEVQTIELGSR